MTKLSAQPARVPIGRTQDGMPVFITREWLNYLAVELFDRAGGSGGASTTELVESSFEDAGIPELNAQLFNIRDGLDQMPVNIQAQIPDVFDNNAELSARISALETAIQDIKQGTLL